MSSQLIGLAFTAGMVAAFNPCGFAMLPAYLALVVQREGGGQPAAVARALAATAAMTVGFVAVFGSFGVLTVSLAATVQRYLPYVTVVVGVVLAALGVRLLRGHELMLWRSGGGTRWAPTGLGSMFGYGVGYALASLSCTAGPFLAVTGSSLRSGSPLAVLLVYLAYAGGLSLVVGVLAVAIALTGSAVIDRMRRVLPYVNRISGAILVAVGLYVAYYGSFELRLRSAGSVEDPVIGAAGRMQRVLAGWVYAGGAWPWLAALVALAAAAFGAWALRRGRRRAARSGAARLDSPV